jgi:ribosomal-protein-alanine N-acetyltransferase
MLSVNFSPFPILETPRLLLRRVANGDVDAVFRLRSNTETMKYVPRPLVTTNEEALAHIATIEEKIVANTGINWAITLKGNDTFIGIIGHYKIQFENYRSEIGYMLLPEFNGQGIVSEAVKRVVEYGFDELRLHSIEAIIDPDNIASARVLEKNDFIKEAHLKENEFYDGKFLDTVIYSLLNPNDINVY